MNKNHAKTAKRNPDPEKATEEVGKVELSPICKGSEQSNRQKGNSNDQQCDHAPL
jgi:hypothetical protein